MARPSPSAQEILHPSTAMGEDGAALVEGESDMQQSSIRDHIRDECRRMLERCAADSATAMSEYDVEEYMSSIAEPHLDDPDIGDKTVALQEHLETYVPLFIRQAEASGRDALHIIGEAEQNQWITSEKAEWWQRKMKEGRWPETREFIGKKLPAYQRNWEKLHADLGKVREKQEALGIKDEDLPELKELKRKLAREKYPEKQNLVDRALAALAVCEKDRSQIPAMQKLYAKANRELDHAVTIGALAKWKKGQWLRRIFESDAPQENIRKFLSGEGPTPLKELVIRWKEATDHFHKIEQMREEKGTPRSFHFVHLNVFLDWHYEKRRAYLDEALTRFSNIKDERYEFLLIRNALDMKDWDEADRLMKEVDEEKLSEKDLKKFRSMKQFLETQRPNVLAKREDSKEQKPTDREIVEQGRSLLKHVPLSEHKLFTLCLRRGAAAFRCLRILKYNREWCWEHRCLNNERERQMRRQAEAMTWWRVKHGHSSASLETNDVTDPTNVQAAIRDQEGIEAPQILFSNEKSAEALVETIDTQKNNRDFWYWTTLIPDTIHYEQDLHVIHNINPQLQKLAYEMDKRSILYTESGDVHYRQALKVEEPGSVESVEKEVAL